MKKSMRLLMFICLVAMVIAIPAQLSFAADATATVSEGGVLQAKAIGAAIAIAFAALGGAIAMGLAIAKAVDGIARQPEADGKIRTMLMLGMVFIETVVIYALIVAILVIFVL